MKLALGPLEMTPGEFWDSTLEEIRALAEGWKWRQERARERDAWMLANIIQPWSKKRLKPKDFLGGEKKPVSKEEFGTVFNKLKREKPRR